MFQHTSTEMAPPAVGCERSDATDVCQLILCFVGSGEMNTLKHERLSTYWSPRSETWVRAFCLLPQLQRGRRWWRRPQGSLQAPARDAGPACGPRTSPLRLRSGLGVLFLIIISCDGVVVCDFCLRLGVSLLYLLSPVGTPGKDPKTKRRLETDTNSQQQRSKKPDAGKGEMLSQ